MPVEHSTESEAALRVPPVLQVPDRWKLFWRALTRFEKNKILLRVALRNAIGVALPLAIGVLTGFTLSGVAVASGALNVSGSDGEDSYPQRARRMVAASLLTASAVFVGGIVGRDPVWAIVVTAPWAFVAGLAVCLGTTAGDLGVISLVTLVVYSAQALSSVNAAWAALLALGGGLFQTGLALMFWPVQRYQPERRALGDLYVELARVASRLAEPEGAPPASQASTVAQQMLSNLDRDRKVETQRYRSLLNQAERIQLCLLTLGRLRRRMSRESSGQEIVPPLDRLFAVAADLLYSAGRSLIANESLDIARDDLNKVSALTVRLREKLSGDLPPFARAVAADIQLQADALAGQFRAVVDLVENASPAGLIAFDKRESSRPAALRIAGTLATLRANLSSDSAACRHAIRMTVCLVAGDAIAHIVGWRRSYWLPMTIALVLKPDFTATFSRGVLRLAGTFGGLVVATVLFYFIHPSLMMQVFFVALFTYALRSIGPANYGVLVVSISALIVLLVGFAGVPPSQVIPARAANTAAGGLFALVAYLLWPTWERTLVREQCARMLDAYRSYFQAIAAVYQKVDEKTAGLEGCRLEARLARSNVEASVDRLLVEPGISKERAAAVAAMLASSHRTIYAIMALDAGLRSSAPAPPREVFKTFAKDVDLTLQLLAGALRGLPFAKKQLPDLREDHRLLLETGDPTAQRYALVNIETDRLTNSLNTLKEQVAKIASRK
jgi:uncharacterized membrane protein YccC